jgi:release factor glutamine methyltransferase
VKVLEVIQRSTDFLARKGVDSPRLQAELLLAQLLGLPRMQLYLNFERNLTEPELEKSREWIKRRSQREPLQQIIGSTSFCGLEIAVNRHVLVPRPETELLAEHAWQFLSQPTTINSPARQSEAAAAQPSTILDFGTGSGCLVIALAVKCPRAQFYALDISAEALEMARANAARHQVADRIQFVQSDGLSALDPRLRFDLIVANPPYIPTSEIQSLQPEVRDYEPRHALDGGADGLDFYRRLAVETRPFLRSGARIMVEFGDGQAPALQTLFEAQNWIVESVAEDYTRRSRILLAKLNDKV